MKTDNKNNDVFSLKYFDLLEKINNDEYINSLSKQEIKNLIYEAETIRQIYKNLELIVKRDANSLYGTSASIFLSLVDFDVAEDITVSGKHAGVIVDRAINNFFKNWGEKELLIIQEFYPQVTRLKQFIEYKADTVNDILVYGDTDSRYGALDMIYSLLIIKDEYGFEDSMILPENNYDGNVELGNFTLFLMDNFINNIIKETLESDITYRGAKQGHLKMTHEVTTRRCVFQKKKKYVMTPIWKDGKQLKSPLIVYKGVELKKGELNKRIKKVLKILVEKFLLTDITQDEIRTELLNLIKYIKLRSERDFVFKYTKVSGLSNIYKNEQDIYVSEKNHIQMKIALFWFNFIDKNNLNQEYRIPFEGQKMCYYYDKNGNVVGVPDDIDINSIPGLPEPDFNKMLKQILVKPILKYISELNEVTDKNVDNFLMNVREISLD